MDLAKAFDTVDHGELINILPGFGINEESLSWFSSYLENRTQLVSVNRELSGKKKIDCGVQQGSVLGPILFILYINTICDLNTGGLVVIYADDTCLFFSGKSWETVKEKTTTGLNRVFQELNSKKLTLNIKKTNCIAFSINNVIIPINNILLYTCGNINSNTCKCLEIIRVTRT